MKKNKINYIKEKFTKCNHNLERNVSNVWIDLINNGMNNDKLKNYIPNFIEGTQVNNDGFNIVGDKGKEVIINHKGKTHKIWKNHLDYIERTKHLNTIDEPTNQKEKKDQ